MSNSAFIEELRRLGNEVKLGAAATAENHTATKERVPLFMPDWFFRPIKSPYLFLILGVISIAAAAIFTCTGKAWVRFNGWVYRAKEPKWFWWEVTLDCLLGLCFVG